MSKEAYRQLRGEVTGLLVSLASLIAILKIVYYREPFLIVMRHALSLFWLFILPGYFMMVYWKEKIGLTERIAVGTLLAAALISIVSYYAGLTGLDVKYHIYLLPAIIICAGAVIFRRKIASFMKEPQNDS